MPRAKRKKRTSTTLRKMLRPRLALDPMRTGMPALDSIVGVKELRKGKKVYRLIVTNEVDEYEQARPKIKRKKR